MAKADTKADTKISIVPGKAVAGGELVNVSGQLAEMAQHLGYEGALTVGAIEDEIRFYQRQTVEACIELGKRLLVLKELTPHGEFEKRLTLLGFEKTKAHRFMKAAGATVKSCNLQLLSERTKTFSTFWEIVISDDDVVENILEWDDIDKMTASELRARLRKLEADGAEDADTERKRANRIQAQLEKSEDLLDTLKSAREVNPEFDLETNVVREQSALLEGHCAAALDLLDKMADALEGEALGEGEFKARFHCVWFSANAVYTRALVLLERLRDMGEGCLPESLDEFGAGSFSRNEAQHYLAELTAMRTALGKRSDKIRQDAEDNAPRGRGRPRGSQNKAKGE